MKKKILPFNFADNRPTRSVFLQYKTTTYERPQWGFKMPITYSCDAWQVTIDKLLKLNSIYIKWNVTIARNLGSSKHTTLDCLNRLYASKEKRGFKLEFENMIWTDSANNILTTPSERLTEAPRRGLQGSFWSVLGFGKDQVMHVEHSSLLRHDNLSASSSTAFYKLR